MHTLMLNRQMIRHWEVGEHAYLLKALEADPLWERDPATDDWRCQTPEQVRHKVDKLMGRATLLQRAHAEAADASRALVVAMQRVNLECPLQVDGPPTPHFEVRAPGGDWVRYTYRTWEIGGPDYQPVIDDWVMHVLVEFSLIVAAMDQPTLVWRARPVIQAVLDEDGDACRLHWKVRARGVFAPLQAIPA